MLGIFAHIRHCREMGAQWQCRRVASGRRESGVCAKCTFLLSSITIKLRGMPTTRAPSGRGRRRERANAIAIARLRSFKAGTDATSTRGSHITVTSPVRRRLHATPAGAQVSHGTRLRAGHHRQEHVANKRALCTTVRGTFHAVHLLGNEADRVPWPLSAPWRHAVERRGSRRFRRSTSRWRARRQTPRCERR